jgi:acetyl coenzyme A synthetase (ADP forming)-like protein
MSLHTLFSPKSIAVIGASTRPGSVGNDIAKNLIKSDFRGKVFLVNPKGGELFGKTCFPSISEISEDVDLVIIIVPAAIVPSVLREAGEKMVRAAVIISAGFRETGPAGQALEEEIIRIATEYKMELLGPNCLGFIRPKLFLNASFASTMPVSGPIAFFSQSGALTSAFLDITKQALGFSTFASIGNKATLNETTLLAHFAADDASKVIGFYTEGLTDATSIIAAGEMLLEKKKPVIALKSGTTEAGTSASSSHTGAVAGSDAAYTALFRQAGILRATNFQDLLELLAIFAHNPLPSGNRVAIITNAGGLGVLATDAVIENGLELATLHPNTIALLKSVLPPAGNCQNPIDVLGDALADRYEQALNIVAQDEAVDMLLIILTPQTMTEDEKTATAVVQLKKHYPKLPIATVFSGRQLTARGEAVLHESHIVNTHYPERAARMLGALAQLKKWQITRHTPSKTLLLPPHQTVVAREIIDEAFTQNTEQLGEEKASRFLAAYGFPFLQSKFVSSSQTAKDFALRLGRKVALKIVSPDIIHKSDVGGVMLDIHPNEADIAYEHLIGTVRQRAPGAHLEGAMVVEMAESKSIELLLGLKKEPGLGTLVVVGLGGIYVEIFKDVAMRFAPLTEHAINEMLHELKSSPLLQGARGQQAVDLSFLKTYLATLSEIALTFPEIVELDINPLAIASDGTTFRVLDARIRIEKI